MKSQNFSQFFTGYTRFSNGFHTVVPSTFWSGKGLIKVIAFPTRLAMILKRIKEQFMFEIRVHACHLYELKNNQKNDIFMTILNPKSEVEVTNYNLEAIKQDLKIRI